MDIAATLDDLQRKGFAPAQTGIVGFCMGGSVSFYAASTHALGAGVTYYGGGVLAGRGRFPSPVGLGPLHNSPWPPACLPPAEGTPPQALGPDPLPPGAAPVGAAAVTLTR